MRLGGALYPWAAAAPAIVGSLAFGGRWDSALRAGAGIPIAMPAAAADAAAGGAQPAPADEGERLADGNGGVGVEGGGGGSLGAGEGRRSGGWRVWLGSWRRREVAGQQPIASANLLGQVGSRERLYQLTSAISRQPVFCLSGQ